MKKVIAVLMVFLLVFSVASFAKSSKKVTKNVERSIKGEGPIDWAKQENVITTNPVGLIFGVFNVHYEKALSNLNGLGANAFVSWYNYAGWGWFGLGVLGEYNWYFQKHALNGWWAGPVAGFSMYTFSYEYDTVTGTFPNYTTTKKKESATAFAFNLGGKGGYRWIFDGGFTVDCSLQLLGYLGGGATIGGVASPLGAFGFGPGVNIGYAF